MRFLALAPVLSAHADAHAVLALVLDRARQFACAGVQLDATSPGLRPRELDRSARRGLAALVRRRGLVLSGLDLFIPEAHWSDPARIDRALAAAIAALDMARELADLVDASAAGSSGVMSRGIVAVAIPEAADAALLQELRAAAERSGAVLANHAWPLGPQWQRAGPQAPRRAPAGGLALGVSPMHVMRTSTHSAADAALQAPGWLASARACPGSASAQAVQEYVVALAARGFDGPLVVPGADFSEADVQGRMALEATMRALARVGSVVGETRAQASRTDAAG